MRGEAGVGVVDTEVKAELGAGGEHAVGLVGAFADEVVDEDAGVGFGAVEGERGRGQGIGDRERAKRAALMPAIRPWQAASS